MRWYRSSRKTPFLTSSWRLRCVALDRGHGSAVDLAAVRDQIRAGEDPLGEAFCRLRGRAERRALGQTFTPPEVIASMISWAANAAGTEGVTGIKGVIGTGGEAGTGSEAGTGGVAGDRGGGPARVVDPGVGSARFLIAAGRRWRQASLLGAEVDPVAAIIGRASLAAAGMAGR